TQRQMPHEFRRIIKEQVYQPAHDADAPGQNQMKSFLIEPDFLPNLQGPLPMLAQKLPCRNGQPLQFCKRRLHFAASLRKTIAPKNTNLFEQLPIPARFSKVSADEQKLLSDDRHRLRQWPAAFGPCL